MARVVGAAWGGRHCMAGRDCVQVSVLAHVCLLYGCECVSGYNRLRRALVLTSQITFKLFLVTSNNWVCLPLLITQCRYFNALQYMLNCIAALPVLYITGVVESILEDMWVCGANLLYWVNQVWVYSTVQHSTQMVRFENTSLEFW